MVVRSSILLSFLWLDLSLFPLYTRIVSFASFVKKEEKPIGFLKVWFGLVRFGGDK